MDTGQVEVSRVRRPGAVVVAGWLALLSAPLMVWRATTLMIEGGLRLLGTDPTTWTSPQAGEAVLIVTVTVFAVGTIVAGIAILRLKRWAWVFMMLFLVVGLVANLVRYFYTGPEYVLMVVYAGLTLLLNQGEVRKAFRIGRQVDEPIA